MIYLAVILYVLSLHLAYSVGRRARLLKEALNEGSPIPRGDLYWACADFVLSLILAGVSIYCAFKA